jgi:hypothetical protein
MKVRSTASTIFILFPFGALSALAQSHPPGVSGQRFGTVRVTMEARTGFGIAQGLP